MNPKYNKRALSSFFAQNDTILCKSLSCYRLSTWRSVSVVEGMTKSDVVPYSTMSNKNKSFEMSSKNVSNHESITSSKERLHENESYDDFRSNIRDSKTVVGNRKNSNHKKKPSDPLEGLMSKYSKKSKNNPSKHKTREFPTSIQARNTKPTQTANGKDVQEKNLSTEERAKLEDLHFGSTKLSKIENNSDIGPITEEEITTSKQKNDSYVKCAVTTYSTSTSNHARRLAKHLKIPFQSPENINADFILIVSEKERLILKNTGLLQNYYVDFYQIHHEFCSATRWSVKTIQSDYDVISEDEIRERMRINTDNLKKPRFKVLRHIFPEGHESFTRINQGDLTGLRILDLTGGMGVNGYIYASGGANVTIVEKDPVLYSLLYEGYELAKSIPGVNDVMKRIKVVHADPLLYLSLKGRKKSKRKPDEQHSEEPFPWDAVIIEPRYYDGIAPRQGYYNKNVEEVLKPYTESHLNWDEYSKRVENLYFEAIKHAPVLIKYPVMSTKFIDDGHWIMQKHDPQYIDWVFKRFKDQEYEYQLYLPSTDLRSRQSVSPINITKQKEYLNLKFKEHQRKARKAGGKDALRESEAEKLQSKKEKNRQMIEIVDDDTPVTDDELSSIDIERMRSLAKNRKTEQV